MANEITNLGDHEPYQPPPVLPEHPPAAPWPAFGNDGKPVPVTPISPLGERSPRPASRAPWKRFGPGQA